MYSKIRIAIVNCVVFGLFSIIGVGVAWIFIQYPVKDAGHVASWIQAIGSILAILGSLGLVQYQINQSRVSKESAAAARALAFVSMLKFLRAKLGEILVMGEKGGFTRDQLDTPNILFKEWLQDARAVPFESLSVEWLTILNIMRAGALQVSACFDREINASDKPEVVNFNDSIFSELKEKIHVFCDDFDEQESLLNQYSSIPHEWQNSGVSSSEKSNPQGV